MENAEMRNHIEERNGSRELGILTKVGSTWTLSCWIVVASLAIIPGAFSAQIAFEWTEGGPGNGTNSIHTSFHNAAGPVLADDFIPVLSGPVVQVDWWGSITNSSQWEITFHSDAGAQPAFPDGDGSTSTPLRGRPKTSRSQLARTTGSAWPTRVSTAGIGQIPPLRDPRLALNHSMPCNRWVVLRALFLVRMMVPGLPPSVSWFPST